MTPSRDIARLLEIMAALRTPGAGCPWDLEQNFATIAPYTLEEAYEVADAIARGDLDDLKDELGDLLLQVVFHARMAEEQGRLRFRRRGRGDHHQADPPASACFRRRARGRSAGGQRPVGAHQGPGKRRKSRARRQPVDAGALAGVPVALPALTRALKLQDKASRVGFDWNDPRAVLRKIREEADEIEAALDGDTDKRRRPKSAICCLPWSISPAICDADPEAFLRQTNQNSSAALRAIEQALAARGKTPQDATLAEMDALWDEAKADGVT